MGASPGRMRRGGGDFWTMEIILTDSSESERELSGVLPRSSPLQNYSTKISVFPLKRNSVRVFIPGSKSSCKRIVELKIYYSFSNSSSNFFVTFFTSYFSFPYSPSFEYAKSVQLKSLYSTNAVFFVYLLVLVFVYLCALLLLQLLALQFRCRCCYNYTC